MPKSILVSELTHSSLFLLQAKLMVSDKRKYSMNEIVNILMTIYDRADRDPLIRHEVSPLEFKLENIET